MNDPQTTPVASSGPDLRLLTHVAYGLFALGFLTGGILGIATLAAIVLLYIKRSDTAGTIYAGHFDWLLRTFWWTVLWLILSGILTWIFIGWIGMLVVVIWALYRLIRGWLALFDGTAPASHV